MIFWHCHFPQVEDLALKEHWISQIPLKGRKISQSIPVGSDRPGWSVSTTSQACVPADFQPTDSKGDGGDRRGPGKRDQELRAQGVPPNCFP